MHRKVGYWLGHLYNFEDGFLWVSTLDGLIRFDGQRFRRFGERSAGELGLSRGAIAGVSPDNEGKFVVTCQDFYGYFGNIICIYPWNLYFGLR